jgi:hypothetical protein
VVAGYSDADWAGNADDRKSTSGVCFYVGTNLVAWMSRNNLLFHSQLLRLNTLLLEAIALNCYG